MWVWIVTATIWVLFTAAVAWLLRRLGGPEKALHNHGALADPSLGDNQAEET